VTRVTFAELIGAIVVVGAAVAVALPSRWSLLPVALAVALPVVVATTAKSTQDDSPQSLAVVAIVIVSAPLLLGVAIGSGLKAAVRSHRRRETRERY
jgi:hypothetical protein